MNIGTLSDIIHAEEEIMQALEFAREEQSLSHSINKLHILTDQATNLMAEPKAREMAHSKIKTLLRGIGRLNRAVRQLRETAVAPVGA
jgi:hypothetical protein